MQYSKQSTLFRNLYPNYKHKRRPGSPAHIASALGILLQKEPLQPKICICLAQRLRRSPSSSSVPNGHWAPRLPDWFSFQGTLGSPFRGAASPRSTGQSIWRKIIVNMMLKYELRIYCFKIQNFNNWGCMPIPVVGGKLCCQIQR